MRTLADAIWKGSRCWRHIGRRQTGRLRVHAFSCGDAHRAQWREESRTRTSRQLTKHTKLVVGWKSFQIGGVERCLGLEVDLAVGEHEHMAWILRQLLLRWNEILPSVLWGANIIISLKTQRKERKTRFFTTSKTREKKKNQFENWDFQMREKEV
jgi:hypothetical protein